MTKIKVLNPLLVWMNRRIDKNKNIIMVINGATGSGKTYAALQLAHEFAEMRKTNFSIDGNVDFNFKGVLEKTMQEQNLAPGTPFVFEEVGAMGSGSSSREWQSQANKFFFSFLQTTRHRRQVLIMTCPHFEYLEKGARNLVHLQVETAGINFKTRKAKLIPHCIQVNQRTGKMYFKYLRYVDGGIKYKFKYMEVDHPPMDMAKEYEKIKLKYTTALNKSIIDAEEKSEKRKPHNKVLHLDSVLKLKEQGFSTTKIADIFKVTVRAVQLCLKNGDSNETKAINTPI